MSERPGKARCSEEEFIRLYRQLGGSGVASYLNLRLEKVHKRRRAIEKRLSIVLKQSQNNDEAFRAIRTVQLKSGRILIGNDAHYVPGQIPTMHRAFLMLSKKFAPDVIVANGDFCDFSQLSRFPSIGWEDKPTVQQELETVQDRMFEIRHANKNADYYWTAGNHDLRLESRLAAVFPEGKKMHGVHLKDHVPGYTPCWAVQVNPDSPSWTEIRHRELNGIHASYRSTVASGVTTVCGHDHRADVVPYNDRRGRRYGVRTGMMAESPLDAPFIHYMEARRVNWQSAICLLTYRDGELLCPELCLQMRPGVVEFRGEVFEV